MPLQDISNKLPKLNVDLSTSGQTLLTGETLPVPPSPFGEPVSTPSRVTVPTNDPSHAFDGMDAEALRFAIGGGHGMPKMDSSFSDTYQRHAWLRVTLADGKGVNGLLCRRNDSLDAFKLFLVNDNGSIAGEAPVTEAMKSLHGTFANPRLMGHWARSGLVVPGQFADIQKIIPSLSTEQLRSALVPREWLPDTEYSKQPERTGNVEACFQLALTDGSLCSAALVRPQAPSAPASLLLYGAGGSRVRDLNGGPMSVAFPHVKAFLGADAKMEATGWTRWNGASLPGDDQVMGNPRDAWSKPSP